MKLEWEQNPPSELMTWDEAMEYANSLSDGWRLPTRGELVEAYDNNIQGFKKELYWSSNTFHHYVPSAWGINFNNGLVGIVCKESNYYVRCVRELKNE